MEISKHTPHSGAGHGDGHDDHHDQHGHHEPGFWGKYIFSTDHKVIGIQYGLTGLTFLFLGFCMMMLMRWQIAYPGQPLPFLGDILAWAFPKDMPNGIMTPDFYNALGAMHGTVMIFLGIVPISFGAFGNYVVPLQIGAPDMAFPKLNMASYWLFFIGGVIMFASFFVPGGAAKSGWTSYPPLSNFADVGPDFHPIFNGQTIWIISMVFLITSSLLGSVNIITTIIQLRAPGMTWMRLPFIVWAMLVTAYILLLAFPPLEAAGFMQLMDRVAGTSFFNPDGLVINHLGGQPDISGGGSPLLWQHLFWFLGHPEVYVMILPSFGIVAEILSNNTRKPIWAYNALVFSVLFLGFLSFLVWAHHMYLTGMGTAVSAFFQTTTVMVSVPSVIILTALLISLWGGSIRFTTPMLFAVSFLPMFGIGGLTGLPLAFNSLDLFLHDTYYIIAHFHYIVAPGVIMAIFGGIYYWYPKMTGRMMNDTLGKIHFWGSLIGFNGVFFPMFIQGMGGMHRRGYDGGVIYEMTSQGLLHWNPFMSWSAWFLGLSQLPFIINVFLSIRTGKKVNRNPWEATTLEWSAPSPPPHGNFETPPVVHRGPYEYSVPGAEKDYSPQAEA